MWVIELKPTEKTVKWLKHNKLDICALQYATTALLSDIKRVSKFKKTTLVIQVDYKRDSSSYYFGTNKIYLCSDPSFLAKTYKQRKFVILLHYLHEFRHWMQSEIYHIKDRQLKYTEEDIKKNSKKYWNNRFEKDARNFEKKYVRRFMRYYTEFKNDYL